MTTPNTTQCSSYKQCESHFQWVSYKTCVQAAADVCTLRSLVRMPPYADRTQPSSSIWSASLHISGECLQCHLYSLPRWMTSPTQSAKCNIDMEWYAGCVEWYAGCVRCTCTCKGYPRVHYIREPLPCNPNLVLYSVASKTFNPCSPTNEGSLCSLWVILLPRMNGR